MFAGADIEMMLKLDFIPHCRMRLRLKFQMQHPEGVEHRMLHLKLEPKQRSGRVWRTPMGFWTASVTW
jgi:hypothetical protein